MSQHTVPIRPGVPPPVRPLRRQRLFIGWFASDTLVKIAGSLTAMALPLLLVSVLGSPAQAGLVAAATSIGTTLGMLPGGFLADFQNRRVTVFVCATAGTCLHLALSALVVFARPAPAALFLLLGTIGLCSGIIAPAFTATLKRIVDPRQFGMAASAAEGRSAVIELAVPPLGGFLFAIAPVLPFLVTAAVILAGGLLFLTADRGHNHVARPSMRNDDHARQRSLTSLLAGFAYLWHNPVLRTLLVTGMIANLAGSAVLAAVVFDLTSRGVSPVTIGLMGTAVALGALVGSGLSAVLVDRVRSGLLIIIGLLWMGTCLVIAAIIATPMAIIALLAISMLAVPAINAVVGGYTVAVVPAHLQGRSDAAQSLVSSLALPLAPVIAGVGVEVFGFSATAVACAGLVVLSAIPCVLSRRVRSMSTASAWTVQNRPEGADRPGRGCLSKENR